MLINLYGTWVESEMVYGMQPGRDEAGHTVAALHVGETTMFPIHPDSDMTSEQLLNDLAERINVANAAFELVDERDFGRDEPSSQQANRQQEDQQERYFRQGWDAFAKDLVQDFYRFTDNDGIANLYSWMEGWFADHGLTEMVNDARMDMAAEVAKGRREKEVAVVRERAAELAAEREPGAYPTIEEYARAKKDYSDGQQTPATDPAWANMWDMLRQLGVPEHKLGPAENAVNHLVSMGVVPGSKHAAPQGLSEEAVTPALRSELRALLAKGGPLAVSEAIAALLSDQATEQG